VLANLEKDGKIKIALRAWHETQHLRDFDDPPDTLRSYEISIQLFLYLD